MSVRFATNEEIARWDELILNNPDGGNIFSSYEFAMQKETGGYKPRFVIINDLAVTVLEKNASILGKLWYLPKGPNVVTTKQLFSVLKDIESFAKKCGAFLLRVESELDRSGSSELEKNGLIKARPIIPNPSTILLDINPKLDDIMANLPQKGRYAINRAKREGVKIELVESNDANCKIMFDLLAETAEGQFGIRPYEYYRSFWKRFESAGLGQLFFAYYNGQVVAGAYAITFGKKSTYKDGASIRKKVVYGASHLLQWKVIEWAKSRGVVVHDFCGAPPSEEIDNPNHKHHGIGLFKSSFNKQVTDYIGCYDFIINPTKRKIWELIGKKVAYILHDLKYHDFYY